MFQLLVAVIGVASIVTRSIIPLKFLFRTDGNLDGLGMGAKTLANHFYTAEKIRAHTVHFIDIRNTRDTIAVGLAPYRFRLGFYTAYGTKYGNSAVEDSSESVPLQRWKSTWPGVSIMLIR